jgi:hypothetical protein
MVKFMPNYSCLIPALERQLAESQRQTQRAKQLSQHLAREYREMCARLTGYQLKMKSDDGTLYEVQSVVDTQDGHCLLFKVRQPVSVC